MRQRLLVFSLLVLPLTAAWLKYPFGGPNTEETARRTEAMILGLWAQYVPKNAGDPERFYYFHKGGIGLFRYGRRGLTYTQTFRYDVNAKTLKLVFIKSGERFKIPYSIQKDQLTLGADPKMGGEQTYTKRPPQPVPAMAGAHPLARMWTKRVVDRKGNVEFRTYQLQAPGPQGRGTGWYHEGDEEEWSTESFSYHRTADWIALSFPVRKEHVVSNVEEGKDGRIRTFTLVEDPRNYWHRRTYRDEGPTLPLRIADAPLPFYVPGHVPNEASPARCGGAR